MKNVKELVKVINHAIADGDMTTEAAGKFLPIIEAETGRPTLIFNKRVTFYDATTATKFEKMGDAYVNL